MCQEILRVNVLGSVYLTQALLPIMMERREGKIIFISSMAGQVRSCVMCMQVESGLHTCLGLFPNHSLDYTATLPTLPQNLP